MFRDRADAGQQLAQALLEYQGRGDLLVLALPRGGVPVAREVAVTLRAPLDVFVVRKLGVPGHAELAMGAIAGGGVQVLSEDLIEQLGIPPSVVNEVAAQERIELERREHIFRADRPPMVPTTRIAIVVDDGLATGSTMEAAVRALRHMGPARIVVAVPVGARETCDRLGAIADRVVCLRTPEPFEAVGQWYQNFSQTTDEEVVRLLNA